VESSPERLSDFENEIKFIPKLQHRNIVKLQGYCIHRKERILVYEYMINKSLDKFIFGMSSQTLTLHRIAYIYIVTVHT
jgi:serine/threonine protein kinase